MSAGAYLGFFEDLEPQGGLVDFLDCATELVDEVGARLGATDGPIVRGSRRRRIGELRSDFIVDVVLRNRLGESNHINGKFLGSGLEFLWCHVVRQAFDIPPLAYS